MDRRASAFARLFEAVHEGVYIGAIGPGSSSTIAANPHLKLIFGYAGDASEKDVRPFDLDRFVDPHARTGRNLLTFARKRQTTRAMVDLNQVIRETLALRSYEQRVTNVAVIEALSAGLPQVFADGHQVQQVLLNLIINAEQAMLAAHGRGTIVVRTWQDRDRETVVLEINDDGPGIPSDLQPKIFDPFFTTKEVGKGTGLGLTVAYAIVQEHGGRIRLESRVNGGTSFYVELPITGAKLPPAPVTRGRTQFAEEPPADASILI